MIGRVKRWYNKRKRAEKIGYSRKITWWYDPETEDIWMAGSRWSVIPTANNTDTPDEIAKMCYYVNTCELTDDGRKYLDENTND